MRPIVVGAIVLALSGVLSGCGSGGPHAAPSPIATASGLTGTRYVALGDSYTAAPSIAGGAAPSADPGCARSARNYPHLVAEQLGLNLRDASCSAAATDQLWNTQTIGAEVVPPQLDALGKDTALVTVGIGGNDNAVFAHLIGTCVTMAESDPNGSPCADQLGGRADRALATYRASLSARLEQVVEAVHERAPDARILLIGYPQVVPAHGHCSELPLAVGDYPYARRVLEGLNAALRAAAERRHATYVDTWGITTGHDICGATPWIAGAHPTREGFVYHPYAEEQQAVADQVVAVLSR